MPIAIDWTIIIAVFSLAVSFVTLYLAHLRGPDINLAIPGKVYFCHELRPGSISPDVRGKHTTDFVLTSNLLVANTGLRPGIIFSFRVDPADGAIADYELKPPPEDTFPVPLLPGEGLQMRLLVQIGHPSESWLTYQ